MKADLRTVSYGGTPSTLPLPLSRRRAGWNPVRRRPAVAALSLALILVAAAGVGGIALQWHQTRLPRIEVIEKGKREKAAEQAAARERTLRKAADAQRIRAEQAEARNRRMVYICDMRLADQAYLSGDLKETNRILERHRPAEGEEDERGPEWFHLERLCRADSMTIKTGEREDFQTARFSHDGTRILPARGRGGTDVYDASSGVKLKTWPSHAGLWEVSPAGDAIAEIAGGRLVIRDYPSGKLRHRLETKSAGAMAFGPRGRRLAWAEENKIFVALTETGERVLEASLEEKDVVVSLDFPTIDRFLIGSNRGRVGQSSGPDHRHPPAHENRHAGHSR